MRWGRCYDHSFCDFYQFSGGKNWRFSQQPMLWSYFCTIYLCFEPKNAIFFAQFFGEFLKKNHNIGPCWFYLWHSKCRWFVQLFETLRHTGMLQMHAKVLPSIIWSPLHWKPLETLFFPMKHLGHTAYWVHLTENLRSRRQRYVFNWKDGLNKTFRVPCKIFTKGQPRQGNSHQGST
jgi:hypothetical protein